MGNSCVHLCVLDAVEFIRANRDRRGEWIPQKTVHTPEEQQLTVTMHLLGMLDPIASSYHRSSKELSAIMDQLRAQGVPVKDEDVARRGPPGRARLNCLGRYAIASSAPDKGPRPPGRRMRLRR